MGVRKERFAATCVSWLVTCCSARHNICEDTGGSIMVMDNKSSPIFTSSGCTDAGG